MGIIPNKNLKKTQYKYSISFIVKPTIMDNMT